ncbi:MAG: YfhL family 4Fe-4S dicluster ferredoxin [Myxococcales bacterium]|nr:MAG: YfhL family 4Fe-4S dicluster ferredoxin [Myxococcales bacterium]
MAFKITEECIFCGACAPECPNEAIHEGDGIYVIDPSLCTECVGFFDEPQCFSVCPVAAPCADSDYVEAEAELIARARALHPEQNFPADFPSRFRK